MNKILVSVTLIICFCSCLAIAAEQSRQTGSYIDDLVENAPPVGLNIAKRILGSDQLTDPFSHQEVDVNVGNLEGFLSKALGRIDALRRELESRDNTLREAFSTINTQGERLDKNLEDLALCGKLVEKSAVLRAENEALLQERSHHLNCLEDEFLKQIQDRTFVALYRKPSEQIVNLAKYARDHGEAGGCQTEKKCFCAALTSRVGGEDALKKIFTAGNVDKGVVDVFFGEKFEGIVAAFDKQINEARKSMEAQFEDLLRGAPEN